MVYDYVVIGGGVTGLYLAYRLKKQGLRVLLLEKSTEIGGLASVTNRYGTPLEKAYHHFFPTDEPLIRLVKELGLEKKLQWKNVPMGMYFVDQLRPFSSPLHLLQLPHLSPLDKVRLGGAMWYLQKITNWQKLRDVKAVDWLRTHSGAKAYELFWKPLLRSKFSDHYEEVSLAWLWARFFVRAQAKPSLFEKEQLGYILGGVQELYKGLLKQIKPLIKTGVELQKINYKKGNWEVVAKDQTYRARQVILTIPTPAAYQLLGKEPPAQVNYLGAVVGTFVTSQKLTDYYWISMNTEKRAAPFVVFIHHTRLIDRGYYKNRYLYYYGAYLPRDHKYITQPELFQKDSYAFIQEFFPEFNPDKILDQEVNVFPFAQQIVDTQYYLTIPPLQIGERLYLCNFSQIYPFDRGVSYAIGKADELLTML